VLYAAVSAILDPLRVQLSQLTSMQAGVHTLVLPLMGSGAAAQLSPEARAALSPLRAGQGAAVGTDPLSRLYAKFCETLDDQADYDRPIYSPQARVSAVAIVIGGSAFSDAIERLSILSDWLNRLTPSVGIDANITPSPRNLRVRKSTSRSEQAIQVGEPSEGDCYVLAWNNPTLINVGLIVPGADMNILSVNVHRKESAFTDSEDLTPYEIHKFRFDGQDTDLELCGVPRSDAWWCLSYDVSIRDGSDGPTSTIRAVKRSNVVRTSSTRRAPNRLSEAVPPNWSSISASTVGLPGSGLFDALDQLLDALSGYANADLGLEFRTGGQRWLAQLRAQLASVLGALDLLDSIGSALGAGAYGYAFSGLGGTQLLYQELWSALMDPATANRPPFTAPGSCAAMLVFVGGEDAEPALRALATLLSLLGVTVSFNEGVVRRGGGDIPASVRGAPPAVPSQASAAADQASIGALSAFATAAQDRAITIARELVLLDPAGQSRVGDAFLGIFESEGFPVPDGVARLRIDDNENAFTDPVDQAADLINNQRVTACEDQE
jgi:hypothetical protein